MFRIEKEIVSLPDDMYREMEYGEVFFVEGSDSPFLNEYVHAYAHKIQERLNNDENNWVTCRLVRLDAHNPLFPSGPDALLYSALMPSEKDTDGAYPFLKATLRDLDLHVSADFAAYFKTLQETFDDAMDGRETVLPSWKEETLYIHEPELCMAGNYTCSEESSPAEPLYESKIDAAPARRLRLSRATSFEGKERASRELCEPSRLQITPYTYDVLLPDYRREIHFTAQVKALYVLFLNHPEGIRMKEIADYKDEYKQLYLRLTNRSDIDKLRWSVEKLLDVCNPNALNVKKSQCNAALSWAIPEYEMRRYYEIEVNRGQPHRINLDRSLVSMPEDLQQKKSL